MFQSHADTVEKRKNEDTSFFTLMCNAICDNVIARRLEKRPDDKANKPLLITVDNESTKRRIFSRLY